MELFKTLEDRIIYVETLTSIATSGEKITESQKMVVYNILKNYGIPEEYASRIWSKVQKKYSIEEILQPMEALDPNIKLLLVQELVMIFLVSGKYKDEKSKLLQICKMLNTYIKLEL